MIEFDSAIPYPSYQEYIYGWEKLLFSLKNKLATNKSDK